MKTRIIDVEKGIGSCRVGDVPAWVGKYGKVEDVSFFYFHQRDLIVLNEDNPNYELYKKIICDYLELDDIGRKEVAEYAGAVRERCWKACKVLDYILRIRRRLRAAV